MAGISITLAGNFQKLDELKDKAKKTAGSIKESFKDGLGSKAFTGFSVAAAASFAVVVASLKSTIDAGGELQDMITKTGASGKELLILQQAFKNAGLGANDVGSAIGRLQKAMGGLNEDGEPTNQAFSKLKLNLDELIAMDPAVALEKVGAALGAIEDPTQRTATAMQLFGKSGANLLAVFNDPEALAQAKTQLGSLLDKLPGMAAELDGVGDAFGTMDVKARQLGVGIAEQLMPELKKVADWINNTDFTETGGRIGALAGNVIKLAGALHTAAKYTQVYQVAKFAEGALNDFGNLTPEELAAANAKGRDDTLAGMDKSKADIASKEEKVKNFKATAAAKETERKADADKKAAQKSAEETERKAEAEKKSAEEKDKSRAAAQEEYNLESRILSARLKGDAEKVASLEREKKIREEIKRLEGAGWSAEEVRKPAEAKVDAEMKAADLEAKRKDQAEQKNKEIDSIQDRLKELNGKKDGLQFQSTIGKVSSMQRVGGGGGAVGSGLDYARQQNDILRDIRAGQRELIRLTGNRDTEV